MTNQGPKIGMYLGSSRGGPGEMRQRMTMRLTPSIAGSVAEAASRSRSPRKSRLDEAGLGYVRTYLTEQPGANDQDVIGYLGTRGYSITGQDVGLARAILQTE